MPLVSIQSRLSFTTSRSCCATVSGELLRLPDFNHPTEERASDPGFRFRELLFAERIGATAALMVMSLVILIAVGAPAGIDVAPSSELWFWLSRLTQPRSTSRWRLEIVAKRAISPRLL